MVGYAKVIFSYFHFVILYFIIFYVIIYFLFLFFVDVLLFLLIMLSRAIQRKRRRDCISKYHSYAYFPIISFTPLK